MSEYMNVHMRLRRAFGPAKHRICPCGAQAREWAYISSPNERVDPTNGLRYSDDLADYQAMCKPCHERLDKPPVTHCPRGHEKTGPNVLLQRGYRICRACKYAQNNARHARKRVTA